MIINKIIVNGNSYVQCNGSFYTCSDILSEYKQYTLSRGKNILCGDIDSGVWALSYLLSMYKYRKKDFMLWKIDIAINDEKISMDELMKYTCYMDEIYPMFSKKTTIRTLVTKAIKKYKLNYTPEEIRDMFGIVDTLFERPICQTGNQRFRAMAAVAFCNGKEVYCFPWLSHMRFTNFHENLCGLHDILAGLGKVVIIPKGFEKPSGLQNVGRIIDRLEHNSDEIMYMLDFNVNEEVQQMGRELAKHLKCINVFIQPMNEEHNKNTWENCAIILSERTDEELNPYLKRLLQWLTDMSVPGAECILERIKRYGDKDKLKRNLEECIHEAQLLGKANWLDVLLEIKQEVFDE